MKIDIAIYLPSLRGGGAERVMLTLANAFARRGLRVDIVLAKGEGPYMRDVSPQVRVVDLNSSRVLSSLLSLVRYLRRERPHALLSALNHANVVATVAVIMSRVATRIVVSARNTFGASVSREKGIRERLMPILMHYTYQNADGITAVSNGVAEDLSISINIPRERITTIYNPVVYDEIAVQAKMMLDHRWFTPDGPPVILGVGRLTEQKDFQTLIRAFAKVRSRRKARLLILGKGHLRDDLEDLIRELGIDSEVDLPGFVDNPFVYMHNASLFVLSSKWEGLPGTLIQAMACGTQVVSTDCPSGPSEILEGGKWGQLVEVGNVDELAEAISKSLNRRLQLDVALRAQAFNVEKAVEQYLDILEVMS